MTTRIYGNMSGRWIELLRPRAGARSLLAFWRDWRRYRRLPCAEPLRFRDSIPCLSDRTGFTPFSAHYLYQAAWAMERILAARPTRHVDVGSEVQFVAMLSTQLPVTFVDIRPLQAAGLPNLKSAEGSLLNLPFESGSVASLSCLHVAEHVGLGRYGDPLNPAGTRLACAELARVLAPGGSLFFSLPVGRPRVCFNAHRIHAPSQILDYFPGLELAEFSAVNDQDRLLLRIRPEDVADADYACGLFWLRNCVEARRKA
jgi:SAM-dependent methyltransferase